MVVKPGSISTGTLLSKDMGPKFLAYLKELKPEAAIGFEQTYKAVIDCGFDENADDTPDDLTPEDFGNVIEEAMDTLVDLINIWLPEEFMFGPHEGDGADWGVWATVPE